MRYSDVPPSMRPIYRGAINWDVIALECHHTAEDHAYNQLGVNTQYDPMSEYYGFYPPTKDFDNEEFDAALATWPACLFQSESRHCTKVNQN